MFRPPYEAPYIGVGDSVQPLLTVEGCRRARILLAAIMMLGLVARLVYSFALTGPEQLQRIDGADYASISKNIANGFGYAASSYRWFEAVPPRAPARHPHVYRPPLVPMVGALF